MKIMNVFQKIIAPTLIIGTANHVNIIKYTAHMELSGLTKPANLSISVVKVTIRTRRGNA